MRSVIVLCALTAVALSACTDGVNNVLTVADISGGSLAVHFENVKLQTYDSNMNPACNGGKAELRLPGMIKLASGDIKVDRAIDLKSSGSALLTLEKNSFLIGKVCDNGKSKNKLVPEEDCEANNICALLGDSMCALLGTPGVHTLDELEHAGNFSSMIHLPEIKSGINAILKGEWQFEMNVQSNKVSVAHIKLPANEKWMYIA